MSTEGHYCGQNCPECGQEHGCICGNDCLTVERRLISADGSLIVFDSQMCTAFDLYHHFGWDELTAGLPVGATSTDGLPLDRNNPHLRIVAMAECIASARGDKPGRGMDRLGEESWRQLVEAAVTSYHKTTLEEAPGE